mgnify:CR=1 FL=1
MFDDKLYSLKMDKTIEVFTKELSISDLKIKEFVRFKIGE